MKEIIWCQNVAYIKWHVINWHLLLKGASFINNAGLPDDIALWQGCQIIWVDVLKYMHNYLPTHCLLFVWSSYFVHFSEHTRFCNFFSVETFFCIRLSMTDVLQLMTWLHSCLLMHLQHWPWKTNIEIVCIEWEKLPFFIIWQRENFFDLDCKSK